MTPNTETTESKTVAHDRRANDMLKSIVERIVRLEEEKATIAEDIKDVYFIELDGTTFTFQCMRNSRASFEN